MMISASQLSKTFRIILFSASLATGATIWDRPAIAANETVIFDLGGTRLYVPKAWSSVNAGSIPSFDDKTAETDGIVFQLQRGILLRFPEPRSDPTWRHRYPEIQFPFVYELRLDIGPRNLKQLQQRDPKARDPLIGKQLENLTPDADGFFELGEHYYVAANPDDNDGLGGYLSLSCRANLTDKDSGISRRCTIYTYPAEGVAARIAFDGYHFQKPAWRNVPKQVEVLVKWLTTLPTERNQTIR